MPKTAQEKSLEFQVFRLSGTIATTKNPAIRDYLHAQRSCLNTRIYLAMGEPQLARESVNEAAGFLVDAVGHDLSDLQPPRLRRMLTKVEDLVPEVNALRKRCHRMAARNQNKKKGK